VARRDDDTGGVERPRHFERPWVRSERPVPRRVVRPLEQFLELESGSAALLMVAALAALVWSNVSLGSYEDFWATAVVLELGPLKLHEDLGHLVNDLLMAVFFYVVSLEVKREFLFGALRERASAAVPVAAALGTMVGGALTYLAVNVSGGEPSGWAIPAATDIAFALGVLGIAGRRAPRELRAFLLTLAVVDDLGTIAIIALFYSSGLDLAWLGGALGFVVLVVALQRIGVRHLVAYVLLAGLLWYAVLESGVHATIAGVVLGFLTPSRALHSQDATGEAIAEQLTDIAEAPDVEVDEAALSDVRRLANEAVSPLARMETLLHPWSAYAILPVFALANAGVPISGDTLGDALTSQVGLGIFLGLVIGAPVFGILLTWAAMRLTPARMPEGLVIRDIAAVSPLKGIGFTVAIFISVLAFEDETLREQAKLSILLASTLAGAVGATALYVRGSGRRAGRRRHSA
jgi:Na+:H+ antiporter, NhaA family